MNTELREGIGKLLLDTGRLVCKDPINTGAERSSSDPR